MNKVPSSGKQKATELLAIFFVLFGFALVAAVPVQAIIEAGYWLKDGQWPNFITRQFVDPTLIASMTHTSFLGFNELVSKCVDLWASIPISLLGVIWFVLISVLWK